MHTPPSRPPKIVCIGGGGGLPRLLGGLRRAAPDAALRAIVAVTDEGRSSGPIRAAFGVPAPGDVRNALLALADPATVRESGWAALFAHRCLTARVAPWEGMAVGNVLLAALAEQEGDFLAGVAAAGELLGVHGAVLPVSGWSAHLAAELDDGQVMEGEMAVRGVGKPLIRRLLLQEGVVPASPAALTALAEADLIVLGPGSLYTSLLACLVFDGMPAALAASRARRVFVTNSTTQPGQTDGYTLTDHLAAVLHESAGRILDTVLVNTAPVAARLAEELAAAGVYPLLPQPGELEAVAQRWDLTLLPGDWITPDADPAGAGSGALWNKVATAPHHADRLARALLESLDR